MNLVVVVVDGRGHDLTSTRTFLRARKRVGEKETNEREREADTTWPRARHGSFLSPPLPSDGDDFHASGTAMNVKRAEAGSRAPPRRGDGLSEGSISRARDSNAAGLVQGDPLPDLLARKRRPEWAHSLLEREAIIFSASITVPTEITN